MKVTKFFGNLFRWKMGVSSFLIKKKITWTMENGWKYPHCTKNVLVVLRLWKCLKQVLMFSRCPLMSSLSSFKNLDYFLRICEVMGCGRRWNGYGMVTWILILSDGSCSVLRWIVLRYSHSIFSGNISEESRMRKVINLWKGKGSSKWILTSFIVCILFMWLGCTNQDEKTPIFGKKFEVSRCWAAL